LHKSAAVLLTPFAFKEFESMNFENARHRHV
jgi:hypothetical protein